MKITAFIASAILAHAAVAVPVQSLSPSEKNSREIQKHQIEDLPPTSGFVTPEGIIEIAPVYPLETISTGIPFDSHPDNLENSPTNVDDIAGDGLKNQTNTTVSAQHRYQPDSHSAQGGYRYTEIEALFDEMLSEYEHEGKHSKPYIPRLDNVGKALQRFKALNSTNPSDDEKVQLIIDQLESDLRKYRNSGYKHNSPQVEVAAIHKAEDRLRRLNVTRDASLRHGEKLRDYCYQVDGSHHRQESCARETKQKVTATTLHNQPSWNSTALRKRATMKVVSNDVPASQAAEEASPSPTSHPTSVESLVSRFTLAYCPGESEWKPAEQFEDVSDCARYTYSAKADEKLERRDEDPTPDPAWLDKFLYPEQDNSLPKRNEKRWEFEGSMNMEYEHPQSHETTDVDVEANWLSDWKRSVAQKGEEVSIFHTGISANRPAKRELADQVRKLENEIETKIAKPLIEFKNATEDATDPIQDAVEHFTARVHKHKSHSPGEMNVTATFDPSKHRKRGLPESVRKLENEVGSKITEPFNELTEPFAQLKNSTKRGFDMPEKFLEELYKDEDFRMFVHNLFNETFGNSTQREFIVFEKVFEELYKDEDFQMYIDELFNETSDMDNFTECSQPGSYNNTLSSVEPRMHARDVKRSHFDHGNCHRYGSKSPNEEFSRANARNWFSLGSERHRMKHFEEDIGPDGEHWLSKQERAVMYVQLMEELKDVEWPSRKARF